MDFLSNSIPQSISNYFPITNTNDIFKFVTEFILGTEHVCATSVNNTYNKKPGKQKPSRVNEDANIALLSIVLGIIEHSLTTENDDAKTDKCDPISRVHNFPSFSPMKLKFKSMYDFASVELDVVLSFYSQFQNVILSFVDLSEHIDRIPAIPVVDSLNIVQSKRLTTPTLEPEKPHEIVGLNVDFSTALSEADTANNNNNNLIAVPKLITKPSANTKTKYCSKELLKSVSDAIWVRLQKSYQKDRSHQQSLFSFLTSWRLDSFGVAVSVVAAAQLLGLSDVHLALSEDHAWVTFGEEQSESSEVTWHGKAVEDKRGEPITDSVAKKRWLYLGGRNAIKCDRASEVAACVASMSMNMGVGSEKTDSNIVAFIQQKILWYMYYEGLLDNYPTCIALLGDLEDIQPYESSDSSPLELYQRAIRSSVVYYADSFVYPYIHLGKHCLRKEKPRESLANWARAATVIGRYNYDKEEEEIYREFFDIATIHIPSVVKRAITPENPDYLVCEDPISLCYIIQFIDGICLWEEGSSTPVLHISWAEKFLPVLSQFAYDVRKRVVYVTSDYAIEQNKLHNNLQNDDARSSNCSSNICSPNMVDSGGINDNTSTQQQSIETGPDLHAILQEMSQNMFSPLCYLGAPDSLSQPSQIHVCKDSNKIELRIHSKKIALISELVHNEKFNPTTANLQLTAQTSQTSERKRIRSNPYNDFTFLANKRKK
ncbi:uncharacterized protein LOC142342568 isoform X2 [Convolutriloba macropyga]|uniref:uncharacterized protein LOC142342568 isoform X2 n=1 Tax=Convolutriloba macropyga TaxID=536237 RepID=UPI003F520639